EDLDWFMKHAPYVRGHAGAEIGFERLRSVAEGGEDQSVETFGAQALQTVLSQIETLRHAAFSVHSVLERHAAQFALKIVSPSVIGAGEILFLAAGLGAQQRALVSAAVDHRMNVAVLIARRDDGGIADVCGPVTA